MVIALPFSQKNRRTLKMIRYDNHKIILYDISDERDYKFIKSVYKDGIPLFNRSRLKLEGGNILG